MNIEIGKTYKNRYGDYVDIFEDDGSEHWPMRGKNRSTGHILIFQRNGAWTMARNNEDLIEEVNTDENERTT